jgi:small subunit ribosomal protein S8
MDDIFSNFLTSLQNGLQAKKLFIDVPASIRLKPLIFFFIDEGLIYGFEIVSLKETFFIYRIFLKYDGSNSLIRQIKRISKISRRIFVNKISLRRIYKPNFLLILSTRFGFLSGTQALKLNCGGELFCIIY